MNITKTTPETLSKSEIDALNRVVSRAFEHTENETQMIEETTNHLAAADIVQIATDDDTPVALAMYRSCLWRRSN